LNFRESEVQSIPSLQVLKELEEQNQGAYENSVSHWLLLSAQVLCTISNEQFYVRFCMFFHIKKYCPPSCTLKMEAAYSSEKSVISIRQTSVLSIPL
jgi:hypothetical protein